MNPNELNEKADKLRNSGKTKEAIKIYQELFSLYDQSSDHEKAGGALQMIGVSYKIDNETDNSLEYLWKAADYFKKYNIKNGQGNALRDIGVTYEYVNRLDEAEKYTREAIEALKNSEDKAALGITIAKLGLIQTRKGDFGAAEKSLLESLEILEKTDHWFFLATAKMHLAGLYVEIGKFNEALKNLKAAEKIFDEHHQQDIHTRRYAQVWGLMAYIYAKQGKLGIAKEVFLKAENNIRTLNPTAQKVVLQDIHAEMTKEILSTI